MSTTALIAISTPLDGLNFYSELFELKGPTGESIFNTLRIGLSCERCKAMNKASECTHMKHLIPSWKSASKFDMVKAVYGEYTLDTKSQETFSNNIFFLFFIYRRSQGPLST